MKNSNFLVNDENGISYMANVITYFYIEGNQYCLYNIPRNDKRCDIYVAKLLDNNLVEIDNPKEKEYVNKVVKKLLPESNN